MTDALTKAMLKELYLPPSDRFVEVVVPRMRFIMLDGRDATDREGLWHAHTWLFAVVHPIRRVAKERMGKHFVEPPIEGLWWLPPPPRTPDPGRESRVEGQCWDLDRVRWRLMIPATPDWITEELFADAVAQAAKRLGDVPETLRLEAFEEGRSVQIMHVGPPAEQGETMTRLHGEYLPAHGLACNGPHHEIYLTDPRRVAPEKQKTVLRQSVRRT